MAYPLLSTKALNVGGAQRFVAKTPFQAGVAIAARSLLVLLFFLKVLGCQ